MIKYLKDIICGALSLLKGMRVTLKYFFQPATTIQYPKQRLEMSQRFRGLVDLHKEKCVICYQCVKICPTGCLAISHRQGEDKKKSLEAFNYNMELCCFCGLCEQACPASAIFLNKIYEIAVYSREKLKVDLLEIDKYAQWTNAGNSH